MMRMSMSLISPSSTLHPNWRRWWVAREHSLGMGCTEGRLCSRNGMGTPRTMAQDLTPGTDWWNRLLLPQTYALVKKPDWSVDVSACVSCS